MVKNLLYEIQLITVGYTPLTRRNNVTFKAISGETNSSTLHLFNVSNMKNQLLLLRDLGFFVSVFHTKYQLSFKNCSGEKFIKLCINDREAANSLYNKLAIFVTEKVPKSQCFKEKILNSRCVFSLFGGSVKEVHPEKYCTSN